MPAATLDRADTLSWCREFIEHCCILRSPPGRLILTGGEAGIAAWQFYLPVAMLDPEFGHRIGLLFWNEFADSFRRQPFQLCGCESGGIPVACALQATAYDLGLFVNVLEIKKAPKSYGLGNRIDGVIHDLPIMLVDDVVGTKKTMTAQAKRIVEFGLALYSPAFCIASCKAPLPLRTGGEGPGSGISIKALFGPDEFTISHAGYVAKYGKPPQFKGSLR
jgi:hypothetical protein